MDQHLARLPLSHLIEEVVEPYRAFAAEDRASCRRRGIGAGAGRPAQPGDHPGPRQPRRERRRFRREPGRRSPPSGRDDEVAITIADDGPGFAPGIIDRIGEPYVTTRAPAGGARQRPRGRRPGPRLVHRQDAARALRRARSTSPTASPGKRRDRRASPGRARMMDIDRRRRSGNRSRQRIANDGRLGGAPL